MITKSVGGSPAPAAVERLISPDAATALLGLCPARVAKE